MISQDRTTLAAQPAGRTVGQGEAFDPSSDLSGTHGVTRAVGVGIARLEQVISRYPWPTVLIGIGLGFVLARRMR